jgi:hypothetical protein
MCWNQRIKIDSNRIFSKQYHLDLSASNLELDALLARRALSSPQAYLDHPHILQQRKTAADVKLQQELQEAQQDLNTFIEDTRMDLSMEFSKPSTYIPLTVLGIVTTIVSVLVILIIIKCLTGKQ